MDHNLLISELQALTVETKRRNPEVKDAGETALEVLKGGQLPRQTLLDNADTLLQPVILGCKSKAVKVIAISIAALQRLVALGGVPTDKLPQVLSTLKGVSNQAVDIQLKILQTLLSILTFNKDIHEEILGNVLLLCFRLQDSRVSVVSSTAAATLRQAVMLIFDKLSASSVPSTPATISLDLPTEPPQRLEVTPSAMDAYSVFSDLCILSASAGSHGPAFNLWKGDTEKPKLLKLKDLQRTFGLELIESILSGYESCVKKRPELLFLLQRSLHPLLLRLLSEKPTFPVALRVCRLIFLLIRSFINQLSEEIETYLNTLLKLGAGDIEGETTKSKESVPPWLRVLVLEILRAICGDYFLLQSIYIHYDQKQGGPMLYTKIISALGRLVNEKPALLGINAQIHGVGVPATDSSSSAASLHAGYFDLGLEMVASAASVGVSTMNAMMGASAGGLSSQSTLKLRLIEQHDKAEAPLVPETYVYFLALQSLNSMAQGIYSDVKSNDPPSAAARGMASSAWPALLAALSYCIATNLSHSIFAEVLKALQDFTIACGLLEFYTPRDAFLNTLGKYAVPPPAVSAMQTYSEIPHAQRNAGGIAADALGFASSLGTSAPVGPPGLSERNMACLRSTIYVARELGPTLGKAWHDVLEILQNANFMLSARALSVPKRQAPGSPHKTASPQLSKVPESVETKPDILQDLEPESILLLINALFESSKDLPDEAFTTFVVALCQLSSEMIGVDSQTLVGHDTASEVSIPSTPTASVGFNPSSDVNNRRRTSGINISHSIKSEERSFSLTKLRVVSTLNLDRIVSREPNVGWTVITQHLLVVARHSVAPSTIRIQASDTLGEILFTSVKVGKEPGIQHQVFNVLIHQVDTHPVSNSVSTDYDVRSSGYQTLNHLLESFGHCLQVGWETVFDILDKVCQDKDSASLQSLKTSDLSTNLRRQSALSNKGSANLIRIAFPSLTLICTDFLTSLNNDAMRHCITCLGCFGRQKEDVNITLAAIGLLWNVSDVVQGDSGDLWLYLLSELLALGHDNRVEARNSAIQTLFRCIELYGSGLTPRLWEDVFNKIIFPLLDGAQGEESQVIVLQSVGLIFGNFMLYVSALETFDKIYQHFLDRIEYAFNEESRVCCTASLEALEKALISVKENKQGLGLMASKIVDASWRTFAIMGESFISKAPYTQENLIALVRIGSLLHDNFDPGESQRLNQLSSILCSIMAYVRSPEYRPDVDVMSPLQNSICQVMSNSNSFNPGLVLGNLSNFSLLAYVDNRDQATDAKLTYVALSKWGMQKMYKIFQKVSQMKELYEDGTVEAMLTVYSIPINLKYDCPPANRFGNDIPLWKSAMTIFTNVLGIVIPVLDVQTIEIIKYERLWTQTMTVLNGILKAKPPTDVSEDEDFVVEQLTRLEAIIIPRLGDLRVPDDIISQFAGMLCEASRLYCYDDTSNEGTTAPGTPLTQENLHYWAFNLLVRLSKKRHDAQSEHQEKQQRIAKLALPSMLKRFDEALSRFMKDKMLRGNLPMGRTREEELLFVLRHLATFATWDPLPSPTKTLTTAYNKSHRSHLFQFYPLLLKLCSTQDHMPSLWVLPSEQVELFDSEYERVGNNVETGELQQEEDVDAGDGQDLIEVNAKDLARRCLEVIGVELGLGTHVSSA
ncbi:hypothetical protein L204_105237 [Cryptococcus depauperatus]